MSEENVEIVRKHLDALNAFMRGKISSEAWLALWDEEAEFYPLRAQLEGESYLGHDGLMRFVAELTEDFEEVRFEIEEDARRRRAGGRHWPVPGSRASERRRHQRPGWRCSEGEAGQDRLHAPLLGASRGPRSRRALGVGDVGGERGDRAPVVRGLSGRVSAR